MVKWAIYNKWLQAFQYMTGSVPNSFRISTLDRACDTSMNVFGHEDVSETLNYDCVLYFSGLLLSTLLASCLFSLTSLVPHLPSSCLISLFAFFSQPASPLSLLSPSLLPFLLHTKENSNSGKKVSFTLFLFWISISETFSWSCFRSLFICLSRSLISDGASQQIKIPKATLLHI